MSNMIVYQDHIQSYLKNRFDLMLKHRTAFIDTGKSESLHQFRVNGRRSHSLVRFLAIHNDRNTWKPIAKWIRKTTKPLGKLRDLDVAIEHMDSIGSINQTGKMFFLDMEKSRDKRCRKSQQRLKSNHINDAVEPFQKIIGRSMFYNLEHALEYYLQSSMDIVKNRGIDFDDNPCRKTIHDLRIDVKRLRYLLEAFGVKKKTINWCKKLQDYIGAIHDREIQLQLFLVWLGNTYDLKKKHIRNLENEVLEKFSTVDLLESCLIGLPGDFPTDDSIFIASRLIADRDRIYSEFLQYWNSDNNLSNKLLT